VHAAKSVRLSVHRHRAAAILIGLIALLAIASISAGLWVPYDPTRSVGPSLASPSSSYWFGTDELGRDVFSRVVYGVRLSIFVALVAVFFGGLFGTAFGVYSGYSGGWQDSLLMRVTDFALALPSLVIGLVIVVLLGPGTITPALAAVVVTLPLFARVARGSTLAEREKSYVLATRALGASQRRIIFRTIFPAILPVIVVQAAIAAAFAILLEASLSFLGLGVRPPTPSLGAMVQDAEAYAYSDATYAIFPGITLGIIVGLFIALGNTLESPSTRHLRRRRTPRDATVGLTSGGD
jgi:ABC-type dipeptide/oligopeptide/nickel transport system permease subunit